MVIIDSLNKTTHRRRDVLKHQVTCVKYNVRLNFCNEQHFCRMLFKYIVNILIELIRFLQMKKTTEANNDSKMTKTMDCNSIVTITRKVAISSRN